MDKRWSEDRETHLAFEEALEKENTKRIGERRDHTGSGGRTYMTWLSSLGLVFNHKGLLYPTLAGEAILNGASLSDVMTGQLLKFQYPSPFSLNRFIDICPRFNKIHPFRFLLRLMNDPMLGYVTEREISLIVIEEAENDTDSCYEKVRNHLFDYREHGDASLLPIQEFFEQYCPKGNCNSQPLFRYFTDIGNTFVNYLEITQLIQRIQTEDLKEKHVVISPERKDDVERILRMPFTYIAKPNDEEYFQRKFGVDPLHVKDTRDLDKNQTITTKQIQEQKIRQEFIDLTYTQPVFEITAEIINKVSETAGASQETVEDYLAKNYAHGSLNGFMSSYYQMAFQGREEALAFEEATTNIFHDVFGLDAKHIGQEGRVPDVIIHSSIEGWQAIIDNKAYSAYTVTHDHENRMVYTYIPTINDYSPYKDSPLAFFSYIAGGFGHNIEKNIQVISSKTGIDGSAATVLTIIGLMKIIQEQKRPITHSEIKQMFSCNGLVKNPAFYGTHPEDSFGNQI